MADKKTTSSNDEQKARAAARSAAASRLREAHRSEHDAYLADEMRKRGIDWKPKPTPEEKAKAELARILEEYPHLKEGRPEASVEG